MAAKKSEYSDPNEANKAEFARLKEENAQLAAEINTKREQMEINTRKMNELSRFTNMVKTPAEIRAEETEQRQAYMRRQNELRAEKIAAQKAAAEAFGMPNRASPIDRAMSGKRGFGASRPSYPVRKPSDE